MDDIVGRKEEQKALLKIYNSSRPEFLAIFGRRRVGKTYLIRQFFKSKPGYYFQITGIKDGALSEQFYEFTRAVEKTFFQDSTQLKEPTSWMQAFDILTNAIEKYSAKKSRFIL